MKTTVFAHVCIDDNISESSNQYESFGGTAVFIGLILRQLGADAKIIANRGEDFDRFELGLDFFPSDATGNPTQKHVNRMVNGTPKTIKVTNPETSNEVEVDDVLSKDIQDSDLIIIAPLIASYSTQYVQSICHKKKDSAIITLLPQGYYREIEKDGKVSQREFIEADQLLSLTDLVVFSEEDYEDSDEVARQWAAKYSDTIIVVTKGAKGAKYFHGDSTETVETTPITNVKDSVGSGDIFSTAVSLYLANHGKTEIGEAIKFAHKVAATCLSYDAKEIASKDLRLPLV